MTRKIQILLSQVGVLINKNNEILDVTGSRFNIFEVLGVNHYEKSHSAILAEFLNPRGSHALESKFLEKFLESVKLKFSFEANQAKVVQEMWTYGKGRIDIVIESCGKAIIIENKIYAEDQWEQLKRYQEFANKRYNGNYQIFYLTLDGIEASDNSAKDVKYKSLSYKTDVINWLEQCVMISANFPLVRETINQYINHIKTLTNQDMSTKQKDEVVDLMLKNIEASMSIAGNINAVKEKIIIDCGVKLANTIGVSKEKVEGELYRIIIEYKDYLMFFGCETKRIYVSIRTKDIVRHNIENEEPSVENDLFSFNAIKWNPYGYSYLKFSFYNDSTLLKLTDENSSEFNELKSWVERMRDFIDKNLIVK